MKKQLMKRMMAITMAAGVIGTSVFGNMNVYASTVHANAGSIMKLMGTEEEKYTSFEVGTSQKFQLAGTQELAYFKFTTDSTDSFYTFTTNINGTSECRVKTCVYSGLELLDEQKVVDTWTGQGQSNETLLAKKLKPDTTYYVIVEKDDEDDDKSVEGSLIVNKCEDDLGDTVDAAAEIKTGVAGTGYLNECEDVDFLKYTTDGTDSFYSIDVSVVGTEGRVNYKVYDNAELVDNGLICDGWVWCGSNGFANLEKKLEPNKTYYIRLSGEEEITFKNQLKYMVTIKQYKDDVKDTVANAKKITVDKTYSYSLQNETDVDWYQVDTTNYTDYLVNFKNTAKEGDIEIKIYSDKDGIKEVYSKWIGGKSSVSGEDKKIRLTPYKTYYIKVSGDVAAYKIGVNPEGPANAKVKNENSTKKKVTVSWSKVNKANGYEVWKAVKNGKFKKVKTFKSVNNVKWTDTAVKKGTTYKYKIRAYAKKGGKTYYSAFSAEKSIKVK